jgi:oxygen-dependent protoporphyrinogen oxidase
VGGVHAGLTDLLSARSAVPDVDALARGNRSLYLALRRRQGAGGGPVLGTLDGGLRTLVDALTGAAVERGTDVRTGTTATTVQRGPAGYRVALDNGTALDAGTVVLATPAYTTADLVAPLAPEAAAALREIPYADVASVTLEYPPAAVGRPLDGTGFLVPPAEHRLLVGCTWIQAKWPHLAGGPTVLIRCLVGRYGDDRPVPADDDALVRDVHGELVEIMRLSETPQAAHVRRWPGALPQYTVGHAGRVTRTEAALGALPGLHVTGAAYRGLGIAACVTQARATAEAVLSGATTQAVTR